MMRKEYDFEDMMRSSASWIEYGDQHVNLKLFQLAFCTLHTFHRSNTGIMATEDERYRQSSQYRLWSFTPSNLQELRAKTNSLAREQIAPRLSADPPPDFLTADEEIRLVKFFTVELIRAAQFCELPTEIRATAAVFLRRFYVTNSVMTYPAPRAPQDVAILWVQG
ncbi:hypothetical protein NW754_008657 [Fusarium falciforme]|nr:hypothetical protein NW754_008657 [Fusarium falciforme]